MENKTISIKISRLAKTLDKITSSKSTIFLLNQILSKYGKITDLGIDRDIHKLNVYILLKGEDIPIKLNIHKYEIIKNGLTTSFIIKEANSDRDWVNAIINNFILGKEFLVPSKIENYINDFLA